MYRIAARLILALIALSGCKRDALDAPARDEPALRAPEPWTLGAGRDGTLALPPPCVLRSDMLRTVLPRETRIAGDGVTLGMLLAAEVSRAPEERVDGAGAVKMTLGRAEFSALPWPARGNPQAARDEGRWLLAWQAADGAHLWRGEQIESLGDKLEPVDVFCREGRCALLASASEREARLFVGSLEEPASAWKKIALPAGRALRIASLERVMLVADDDLVLVGLDGKRIAGLPAPYGVLDAIGDRELVAALPAGAPHCSAESGGVVVSGGALNRRLRSGLPAGRATVSALAGGLLVTWLAPNDCDSGRKTLFASVLRRDGTPIGPVTAVGAATDYVLAARGDAFDLWIEHERTLSWAPARCVIDR